MRMEATLRTSPPQHSGCRLRAALDGMPAQGVEARCNTLAPRTVLPRRGDSCGGRVSRCGPLGQSKSLSAINESSRWTRTGDRC